MFNTPEPAEKGELEIIADRLNDAIERMQGTVAMMRRLSERLLPTSSKPENALGLSAPTPAKPAATIALFQLADRLHEQIADQEYYIQQLNRL